MNPWKVAGISLAFGLVVALILFAAFPSAALVAPN